MPGAPEEEGFTFVDKRRRVDPSEPAPAPHAEARLEPSSPGLGSTPTGEIEVDLSALFLMLASSALVHLGAAPGSKGGPAQRDLAQARLYIELLRVLRDKTEGHRTAEENALLEEILYDLQLRFVEAAGAS